MAPSVTIGERSEERLEKLQAEIAEETGRTVSLSNLLIRIVDRGVANSEGVIASFRDDETAHTE